MPTISLSTHSLKHAIQWTAPPFLFDRIPNIQFSQISLRTLQWPLYLSFPLSTSDSFVPPEHPFHFSFMCSHIHAPLVPLYLKSIFCTSALTLLIVLTGSCDPLLCAPSSEILSFVPCCSLEPSFVSLLLLWYSTSSFVSLLLLSYPTSFVLLRIFFCISCAFLF